MAYNHRCGIVDAFGGREDLKAGVLRAVGEAEKRFSEDALRILRGIRFASVLGFSLDEDTKRAAKALSPNLCDVSKERIYTEWKKLIGGIRAYEVLLEYSDIISVFLPEIDGFVLPLKESFSRLPWDLRQALLFAITSGRDGFISAAKRLKTDNKILQDTIGVLDALSLDDGMDDNDLRHYLIGKGDYTAIGASSVSDAIGKTSGMKERVRRLIVSGAVRFIRELDFDGKDALALGYSGKECGALLEEILRLCALGELDNQKDAIVEYVKTQKCKQ
jgi:tRNA nucleotidyltransferase (CCA-adding enzyme)